MDLEDGELEDGEIEEEEEEKEEEKILIPPKAEEEEERRSLTPKRDERQGQESEESDDGARRREKKERHKKKKEEKRKKKREKEERKERNKVHFIKCERSMKYLNAANDSRNSINLVFQSFLPIPPSLTRPSLFHSQSSHFLIIRRLTARFPETRLTPPFLTDRTFSAPSRS